MKVQKIQNLIKNLKKAYTYNVQTEKDCFPCVLVIRDRWQKVLKISLGIFGEYYLFISLWEKFPLKYQGPFVYVFNTTGLNPYLSDRFLFDSHQSFSQSSNATTAFLS